MNDIEKLTTENTTLKTQVIGLQNEIVRIQNHLDDMRTLVNRFTEANLKIEYTPILEHKILGEVKDDRKRAG